MGSSCFIVLGVGGCWALWQKQLRHGHMNSFESSSIEHALADQKLVRLGGEGGMLDSADDDAHRVLAAVRAGLSSRASPGPRGVSSWPTNWPPWCLLNLGTLLHSTNSATRCWTLMRVHVP